MSLSVTVPVSILYGPFLQLHISSKLRCTDLVPYFVVLHVSDKNLVIKYKKMKFKHSVKTREFLQI